MKRIGNIYPKIYEYDNIKEAHRRARKDKIHYTAVQMVDENPEAHFVEIQEMLRNKTYEVGKYKCKTIKEHNKKERYIMKLPYYPDRIIQWAIMLQLEKYFLKTFCFHSCASIPRGGQARVHKLMDKYTGYKYCLELDIKKFYPNIDRNVLKQLLRHKFKDQDLLDLLDLIIDSSPKDENSLQDQYQRGVPIGSYLSQFLANFYLCYFDHWLKEEKKCKCVVRYMDNIIIYGNDKNELRQLKNEIEIYLWDNLHLKLKENWQIYPVAARPVDFIGYRYGEGYKLMRKSTAQRFKKLCYKVIRNGYCDQHDAQALASYFGLAVWGDCKRLWDKYYMLVSPVLYKYNYTIKPYYYRKGTKKE